MNAKQLHFKRYGSGPPLIILHGLFGSSDNWHAVAKALAAEAEVFAVDQRNHGRSFHSERLDYPTLAADLVEFMDARGLDAASLLGHSMGGKAALFLAAAQPKRVARLIVADITPFAAEGTLGPLVEALSGLDLDGVSSLKQAEARLEPSISDPMLRLFFLKNIERSPEGRYRWKINLPAIRRNLDRLGAAVPLAPFPRPALFIRGGRSDYVSDAAWARMAPFFPEAELVTLREAGHWVHADAREAFVEAVAGFLRRTATGRRAGSA
jgi:pimeloyl-ACP methyl ester carboxylesterase